MTTPTDTATPDTGLTPQTTTDLVNWRRQRTNAIIGLGMHVIGGIPYQKTDNEALRIKLIALLASLNEMESTMYSDDAKTARQQAIAASNAQGAFAKVYVQWLASSSAIKTTKQDAFSKMHDGVIAEWDKFGTRSLTLNGKTGVDESIAKLKGYMDGEGKVRPDQSVAFFADATKTMNTLAVSDPALAELYNERVAAETGVNIYDSLVSKAQSGKGIASLSSTEQKAAQLLSDGRTALQTKQQNDITYMNKAAEVEANFYDSVGNAPGAAYARQFIEYNKLLGGTNPADDAESSKRESSAGPVPDIADLPAAKAYIEKIHPELELKDDGRVYDSAGDSMPYEKYTGLRLHGLKEITSPYIKETRDIIKDELERIATSDEPKYIELRNQILQSPDFVAAAKADRVNLSDPREAMWYLREKAHQANVAHSDIHQQNVETLAQRKATDPTMPATPAERRQAQDTLKDTSKRTPKGAALLTAGTTTPAESTGSTETNASQDITGADRDAPKQYEDFTGEGGFKYRVYGQSGKIDLIGGPAGKSRATEENPVPITDRQQMAKIMAEKGGPTLDAATRAGAPEPVSQGTARPTARPTATATLRRLQSEAPVEEEQEPVAPGTAAEWGSELEDVLPKGDKNGTEEDTLPFESETDNPPPADETDTDPGDPPSDNDKDPGWKKRIIKGLGEGGLAEAGAANIESAEPVAMPTIPGSNVAAGSGQPQSREAQLASIQDPIERAKMRRRLELLKGLDVA